MSGIKVVCPGNELLSCLWILGGLLLLKPSLSGFLLIVLEAPKWMSLGLLNEGGLCGVRMTRVLILGSSFD